MSTRTTVVGCERANVRQGSIGGTDGTAVDNILRIRRAHRSRQCNMVSPVKILRANRFVMTGQQSLPQLVVYGNPLAVAATSGRRRQLSANSGAWVLFGLRINTQFHVHKTYVTTRQ
jgi:hypothetical protein